MLFLIATEDTVTVYITNPSLCGLYPGHASIQVRDQYFSFRNGRSEEKGEGERGRVFDNVFHLNLTPHEVNEMERSIQSFKKLYENCPYRGNFFYLVVEVLRQGGLYKLSSPPLNNR